MGCWLSFPPSQIKYEINVQTMCRNPWMKDFFIFFSLAGNWGILEMYTAALQHNFF